MPGALTFKCGAPSTKPFLIIHCNTRYCHATHMNPAPPVTIIRLSNMLQRAQYRLRSQSVGGSEAISWTAAFIADWQLTSSDQHLALPTTKGEREINNLLLMIIIVVHITDMCVVMRDVSSTTSSCWVLVTKLATALVPMVTSRSGHSGCCSCDNNGCWVQL